MRSRFKMNIAIVMFWPLEANYFASLCDSRCWDIKMISNSTIACRMF